MKFCRLGGEVILIPIIVSDVFMGVEFGVLRLSKIVSVVSSETW